MRHRVPTVDLADYVIPPAVLGALPTAYCREHKVFPVAFVGDAVVLAMVEPDDENVRSAVGAWLGRRVEVVACSAAQLTEVIARRSALN